MARRYRVLVVAARASKASSGDHAVDDSEEALCTTVAIHIFSCYGTIPSVVKTDCSRPQLSTVRTAARMNSSDHGGPHTGQTGHNHSTPPSLDCNPGRTVPHTGANQFHGSQARFRHDWGMPCSVDNERVIRLSYNGYITGRSCLIQVWTILETATWQSICARFENALRSDDVLG
jgi:hypothetical protein